jgi:hypothetical protein
VANDFNGTIFNLDSKIYKWDGSNFVEAQTIETKGATDWEHFEIEGNHY